MGREKGMKFQVDGCCGCLNLKYGALAISIWQIIFGIAYYGMGYYLYEYLNFHPDPNWRSAYLKGYMGEQLQ